MAILIIEDEIKIVDILKRALKGKGYSVDATYDGAEGLGKALKNKYELIILDIMLPKKGGFAVCKEVRRHGIQTPIIMLTARGLEEERVKGLDAGADDYIVKPFGLNELFARIRSVLRRPKTVESDVWKAGDLVLDTKSREVTKAGRILNLTPKEYMLLHALISRKGEALSRRELIDIAWGPDFKEGNNELNVHMRYLRKKIGDGGAKPLIHTLRGMGFTLKE